MTFKGFLSYHDFYCHIKFNVYHKQFFFNDGTQAPDLANYVFTTRAIKQIKIKDKVKCRTFLCRPTVETPMNALQGMRHIPPPTVNLPRFLGRPESPSDPTIDQWLADFDVCARQCGVPEGERAVCWWTTLVGVRRRKCYVTRVMFVGNSGH